MVCRRHGVSMIRNNEEKGEPARNKQLEGHIQNRGMGEPRWFRVTSRSNGIAVLFPTAYISFCPLSVEIGSGNQKIKLKLSLYPEYARSTCTIPIFFFFFFLLFKQYRGGDLVL